jgi:hypothetical protein
MPHPARSFQPPAANFKGQLGIVVAVLFLGLGLSATFYPVWLIAKQQRVQSYVPVPAHVVDVRRHYSRHHNKLEVSFSFEYEYSFGHRSFRGSDVNLQGWKTRNADLVRELSDAKQNGTTVTAWVDPRAPEISIFDRFVDNTEIALSTLFATLLVTFAYWVLYLGLAPKQPLAPRVFYAFPFKRNLGWRTLWVGYVSTVSFSAGVYLVVVGSGAAAWMIGVAVVAGWFVKRLVERRRFFAALGSVEVQWLSPLVVGAPAELMVRLSRPERLEELELELTCTEHPTAGSFAPRKEWFKRQFNVGDFRVTSSPDTFATTVMLPAESRPTTFERGSKHHPSIEWTFTLKAPCLGSYVQELSPVVG